MDQVGIWLVMKKVSYNDHVDADVDDGHENNNYEEDEKGKRGATNKSVGVRRELTTHQSGHFFNCH